MILFLGSDAGFFICCFKNSTVTCAKRAGGCLIVVRSANGLWYIIIDNDTHLLRLPRIHPGRQQLYCL